MSTLILAPNRDDVVSEVIEGDAVLINVATGVYYSTGGVGGWVWDLIGQEASFDDLTRCILASYAVSEAEARADLTKFIADLRQENLVCERLSVVTPDRVLSAPTVAQPYARPELLVYRDLKDLLALDPPMPRMVG